MTPQPHTAHGGRWTWHAATIAGIPVRIHFTLVLLLLWIAWMEFRAISATGIAPSGDGALLNWILFIGGRILFIVGLFCCVLFHELGHALAGRYYGIRTAEIMLYPFGGVARLKGMGTPGQELWISLAGPAVNIGIGFLLYGGLRLIGSWIPLDQLAQGSPIILQHLALANFILAGFNLIPAFPMDGGRVLRSLLAKRFGMLRGTTVAANIGQAFAIAIGLLGLLFGHFILVFIAFFVFVSASQEVSMQRSIALMRGQGVADAMISRFDTLADSDSLGQAADRLLATHQQDFPVLSGGRVVGVLARADLVRGLANNGPRASVIEAARRDIVRLSPQEPLQDAVEKMQTGSQRVALVFEGDRLIGMVTEENIKEFFQIQGAETR
jgi:Zn-dependent protease/CBS domain-containing protein